jgi:hypothetical protein
MGLLKAIQRHVETGNVAAACQQLQQAYLRIDAASLPADFVAGAVAPLMAEMLRELGTELGCTGSD